MAMNNLEKAIYEQKLLAKYNSPLGGLVNRVGVFNGGALSNDSYELMKYRAESSNEANFNVSSIGGVNGLAHLLYYQGGLTQQERMIRDKRRSLDKAVLYSYQGAFVKKYYPDYMELMEGVREQPPIRALINPDKNKQDYDDKILSIGYEYDFQPGDIFEWIGTNTYWLIYLQELTELAYFRGEIRKCSHIIPLEDGKFTYAAVRGPVETKIDSAQKHGIIVNNPNYSLHILMPKNDDTMFAFKRYSKFYLKDNPICWRVEATDWISTPGILEVTAQEYYSNTISDDIENGEIDAFIAEPLNPNSEIIEELITGETFIKPKKEYTYTYNGDTAPQWFIDSKIPVTYTTTGNKINIKWTVSYSGQFELKCNNYAKTVVVESLF